MQGIGTAAPVSLRRRDRDAHGKALSLSVLLAVRRLVPQHPDHHPVVNTSARWYRSGEPEGGIASRCS